MNRLKAIQNNCIRIIYKQPYDASTVDLNDMAELESLKVRSDGLSIAYFRYYVQSIIISLHLTSIYMYIWQVLKILEPFVFLTQL